MRSLAVVVLLLTALPALGQEETLVGGQDIEHGGYGALVVKSSKINNEFALLMGVRGGWIINHTFSLGLAGYGLVNNVHALVQGPVGERFVNVGYGGLDLEFILDSDRLVHISFHSLIGAGGLGFRRAWDEDWNEGPFAAQHYNAFFIAEPAVNVDLNVTSWFRLSAGMSFRLISGVESSASSNHNLKGPSGMLTLRFGSF
jgi:hypothetical protein